ncbi:ROK family protein [Thalassococcus sp. CAU 1522]|uniref:ROK family protein n=2 Tax=Thalassococcus arenae TaxID=2851652 RepID=A0ABS6N3S5_9RHOB|nr:ROK family protein [Thalassococcus arenae]
MGAVPRVEIARALEISPGTVTALSSDLIGAGYLQEVEGGARESGRGRPPVSLAVVPDAVRVIGIKLSDLRHAATMMNFAGEQIHQVSLAADGRDADPSHVVDRIDRLVTALLVETGTPRDDIRAVGIGLPGLVETVTGSVNWSPLLNSRSVPLARMIRDRLGIETVLENDANLLTLAELWFGKGRAMNNFCVVTIENGIGMGFVLNNRLFRGARGLGMEIGHTKVQLDGALCRCGRRGCLEAYLADYALVREATTALRGDTPDPLNPDETVKRLYEEAKAGNKAARSIFLRASRYLALGLSNVMQLFDPERIIITGERLTFDYFYSEGVLEEMLSMTLDVERFRDRVEVHAWKDPVWALGAGALALSTATSQAMAAL